MVEVLNGLHARPPTPPRTVSHSLTPHGERDRVQGQQALLETPGDSPASANGSTLRSSSRHSKRVNFSPWTNYIRPPAFDSSTTSKSAAELKALRPSNELKPSKSILKITSANVPVEPSNTTPQTAESLAMLVESVTQQLAGESPTSRLDAYMHLLGALKAYEGVPGEQELAGKLGLITQFIQRDICRDLTEAGPLDINLTIHALKLSITLIWSQSLTAQLSDDFKTFIVDHSITCLQDAKMPKSVLNHYMLVLSTQNFHSKVMNNARLCRVLFVLRDVSERIKGTAIISQRLSIYQRLLNQSKSVMASNSGLWIEHLISGLLHHIKDIRSKAISLGLQTSMSLGPNSTISSTLCDIFARPLEKGIKLISEICERMSRMMAPLDSGIHVPQIWSIIILLLRSKKFPIDHWEHFKEWVLVLQKCFNCGESAIKAQAILAWNRFVYVISPDESTSLSLIRMLSKPILSQFERRKHDKLGSQASQLALSSYYNLLYYAFRPSVSFNHLDIVWEEYIVQPLNNIFSTNPRLCDKLCEVLFSLLWSPQAKVWSEDKVNQVARLDPEELPSLDSKWVRSRVSSVLKVFESLFKVAIWKDGSAGISNVEAAWINLSKALSNASSKEVKTSAETMQAVAGILGLFQRLWQAGPHSLNPGDSCSADAFFGRFRSLSTTIILSIGTIPFTEKLLLKTPQETYQTAGTPMHRRPRNDTSIDTPILHLLRLIASLPTGLEPSSSYIRLIESTLEASLDGRISRGARLDLLRQCAALYPSASDSQIAIPHTARFVWEAIAKLTEACLTALPDGSTRGRDGSVSHDHDNVIEILISGLQFPESIPAWGHLLDTFVRVVTTELGEHAICTSIIDTLAEKMQLLQVGWVYSASVSSEIRDSPAMQSSERPVLHSYKLVELVDKLLRESYATAEREDVAHITRLTESLVSFLESGVLIVRSAALEALQEPLELWIKDEKERLSSDRLEASSLAASYRALCSAVPNILQTCMTHDTYTLRKFSTIISSGLDSSHKSTKNRFIGLWNATFGLQKSLEYPDNVLSALRKLEPYINLQLPSLSPAVKYEAAPQLDASKDEVAATENPPKMDGISGNQSLDNLLENERRTYFSSSPILIADDPPESLNDIGSLTPKQWGERDESRAQFIPVDSSPAQRTKPQKQSVTDDPRDIVQDQPHDPDLPKSSRHPRMDEISKFGLDTPTHLRHLSDAELAARVQLTPTLPAVAESDDIFPGSSPTPGSKGQSRFDIINHRSPALQDLDLDTASDPPSSPPEMGSSRESPKGLGLSSEVIRYNTSVSIPGELFKDGEQATMTSGEPDNAAELSEQQPLSVSNAMQDSTQSAKVSNEKTVAHEGDSSSATPTRVSKNKSRSKRNRSKSGTPKGRSVGHQESTPRNKSSMSAPAEFIADSFSDDLEFQVASQLEQDLELAVDLDDVAKEQLAEDMPDTYPVTRKRKREMDESATPSDRSKRRSSITSSMVTRASAKVESTTPQSFKKRKSTTRSQTQDTPSKEKRSSSKKRKGESRDTKAATSSGETGESERDSAVRSSPVPPNSAEKSSKKKRRSRRLSGITASPLLQQTETPKKKSSRNSRPIAEEVLDDQKSPSAVEQSQPGSSHEIAHIPEEKEAVTIQSRSEQEVLVQDEQTMGPRTDGLEIIGERTVDGDENKGHEQIEEVETSTTRPGSPIAVDAQYVSCEAQTDTLPDQDDTSADGILESLRRILGNIKSATFSRETLREMDDVMFDIRVETHEAARRHGMEGKE
ncbi:hypothetical protein NFIA_107330 [Paecilomyces variotii No. 5]|uniref:Telomere-associated protein Rif1 N-terminal domain-containing protein n=1 Tax=Byssochlamys spectabilis (strain No. 5 / NBRC 109023) TaxID=1356009 RepID=V5GC49_BYSSN|nr:hypothetical protein NFIA_107330 [Paecilomyces variotii No. 5]